MSDEKKLVTTEQPSNVLSIEDARIKKLRMKGHLLTMVEDFEILRLKFLYDKLTDKQEAIRFVTLVKYFMDNGPTESFRLSCKMMYEKYIKPYDL